MGVVVDPETPLKQGLLDAELMPGMSCARLLVFMSDRCLFFACAPSMYTPSLRGSCGTYLRVPAAAVYSLVTRFGGALLPQLCSHALLALQRRP